MNDKILDMYKKQPKTWIISLAVGIGVLFLVAICLPYVNYRGIATNGIPIATSILNSLVNPSFEMIFNLTKDGVPYLIFETIGIAFLGTIIGAIISIPISFLASRNIFPNWFCSIWMLVITVIRTFPAFVLGLMFIRVTGPGAFAGVLTLALSSVGMISKLFIEVVEDLDQGIIEALDSTGCTTFQKIRFGIIPQITSSFLSIAIYRFEINIKNASILGLVGAGGIGTALLFSMGAARWRNVGAIIWGLVITVIIFETISSRLRKKLTTGE